MTPDTDKAGRETDLRITRGDEMAVVSVTGITDGSAELVEDIAEAVKGVGE